MTSAEQFGVVFAPSRSSVRLWRPIPSRSSPCTPATAAGARQLVAAATDLARTHDLVVDGPHGPAVLTWRSDQDVQTFGQFANLLPVLFLVAGVLGAFIVLSRLVHAQRAVIGTLTANGIAPRDVAPPLPQLRPRCRDRRRLPWMAGGCSLGRLVHRAVHERPRPAAAGQCHCTRPRCVVACRCGVRRDRLAAWGPARAAARRAPAEAIRVAPAGARHPGRSSNGSSRPLRHLPARWKMVLRGLSRNRRRAVFTIAGVAVSLSLVIVFAGLRDTVASVLDRQYGDLDRSDGQLYANPGHAGAARRRGPRRQRRSRSPSRSRASK